MDKSMGNLYFMILMAMKFQFANLKMEIHIKESQ